MKSRMKNLIFLPVLIAGLALLLADQATAQIFTTLHSFTATDPSTGTNRDGADPIAGLILSGNTLYGTAYKGGTNGNGTVFKVNTNGTGFTNLHSFTATDPHTGTNRDGSYPTAGLILSGNTLYGTASGGGTNGNGTVFKVNTNGTGFTTLHTFTATDPHTGTNRDGANPYAGLILSGNTLYGTAIGGGTNGNGTVFGVNTNGTGFTTLHNFSLRSVIGSTNSDGALPQAGLILSGNALYGTAYTGGTNGNGTVFKVNTNGTGFTILHTFTALDPHTVTNRDGANPIAGLILSGSTLYGTAYLGGTNANGTVFAVNINGTGFTNLHTFTAMNPNNSDGALPQAGLILSGNTLYGTTYWGGTTGNGTVFAVNTNGTGFTTLYSFTADDNYYGTNSDGAEPYARLILSGNTLYGTAYWGGTNGNGTVFGISFRPPLAISHVGTNVILTWPTNVTGFNYTGYALQSTTNLVSPAVWSAVSPTPVIVNGQKTVTNSISSRRKFYRLSQ
jgi:uncharacterized repeat protein (TIGR03803 family)